MQSKKFKNMSLLRFLMKHLIEAESEIFFFLVLFHSPNPIFSYKCQTYARVKVVAAVSVSQIYESYTRKLQ